MGQGPKECEVERSRTVAGKIRIKICILIVRIEHVLSRSSVSNDTRVLTTQGCSISKCGYADYMPFVISCGCELELNCGNVRRILILKQLNRRPMLRIVVPFGRICGVRDYSANRRRVCVECVYDELASRGQIVVARIDAHNYGVEWLSVDVLIPGGATVDRWRKGRRCSLTTEAARTSRSTIVAVVLLTKPRHTSIGGVRQQTGTHVATLLRWVATAIPAYIDDAAPRRTKARRAESHVQATKARIS